jgi:hypothetical protein
MKVEQTNRRATDFFMTISMVGHGAKVYYFAVNVLCVYSTWPTQQQVRERIPVISQLGSLSFKLGRYLLAWALSQLEIRSMICYLDWIVSPLYKEDPL